MLYIQVFGQFLVNFFIHVRENEKCEKFEGSSVTQFLNCSNRAQKWQVASVAQKTLQRENVAQFEHFSKSYDYFCNVNLAIF